MFTGNLFCFGYFYLLHLLRYVLSCNRVWLQMGFWLSIRFVELLDTKLVTTLYKSLSHGLMFSVTVFTVLFGKIFQQWTFLCSQDHVLTGWLSSHTNILIYWLLSQESYLDFSRLTADCTLLYSLCTHPAENTSPNSFSIFAWHSYWHAPCRKYCFPQLLHCCALQPFPGNSCLLASQFWPSADM
jgi:hypothetical protein